MLPPIVASDLRVHGRRRSFLFLTKRRPPKMQESPAQQQLPFLTFAQTTFPPAGLLGLPHFLLPSFHLFQLLQSSTPDPSFLASTLGFPPSGNIFAFTSVSFVLVSSCTLLVSSNLGFQMRKPCFRLPQLAILRGIYSTLQPSCWARGAHAPLP